MSDILIIDNDIPFCELLTELLSEANYHVHCRDSGESALAYMQNFPVDLVIVSERLPNLDGLTVTRRICQRFATPTIMTTTQYSPPSMIAAIQAGADQYFNKGANSDELLARISSLLRRVGLERKRSYQKGGKFLLNIARLPLTETEVDLVRYLVAHDSDIVSKAVLQKEVLKKSSHHMIVI